MKNNRFKMSAAQLMIYCATAARKCTNNSEMISRGKKKIMPLTNPEK